MSRFFVGVMCAAFTFMLQISEFVPPIRGMMRATTFKSSKWRTRTNETILQQLRRHILVVQLQSQLFFGNATSFVNDVESVLKSFQETHDIHLLILDFTLVLAIDSSAAESIANIVDICRKYSVKLCYSRASHQGFPCAVELTERIRLLSQTSSDEKKQYSTIHHTHHLGEEDSSIINIGNSIEIDDDDNTDGNELRSNLMLQLTDRKNGKKAVRYSSASPNDGNYTNVALDNEIRNQVDNSKCRNTQSYNSLNEEFNGRVFSDVHLSDSLDDALIWSEDALLADFFKVNPTFSSEQSSPRSVDLSASFRVKFSPYSSSSYLWQIYNACPPDVTIDDIENLLSKFVTLQVLVGTVLWQQSDSSNEAILLVSGLLISELIDEAGTTELIKPGHLVGEYGLLSQTARNSTVRYAFMHSLISLILNSNIL